MRPFGLAAHVVVLIIAGIVAPLSPYLALIWLAGAVTCTDGLIPSISFKALSIFTAFIAYSLWGVQRDGCNDNSMTNFLQNLTLLVVPGLSFVVFGVSRALRTTPAPPSNFFVIRATRKLVFTRSLLPGLVILAATYYYQQTDTFPDAFQLTMTGRGMSASTPEILQTCSRSGFLVHVEITNWVSKEPITGDVYKDRESELYPAIIAGGVPVFVKLTRAQSRSMLKSAFAICYGCAG